MENKLLLTDKVAEKYMIQCQLAEPFECPYLSTCPHEDKEICQWQEDCAKEIIPLIAEEISDEITRVDWTVRLAVYLMQLYSNANVDEWEKISREARQAWLTDASNIVNIIRQALRTKYGVKE